MSTNEEKESMKTDETNKTDTIEQEEEVPQEEQDTENQVSEEADNVEEIAPTIDSLQAVIDSLQAQLVAQESRIHNLQESLQQSQKNSDELTSRLKSVSAAYKKEKEDQESFKQRLQRNMEYKESRRRGEVVKVLFEPLENLRRSTAAIQKNAPDNAKGLEMIIKSFLEGFKKLGLEEINPVGEKFDPNQHEALMQQPVEDPALDDAIVNVFSTGYRIETMILKPAQVIVGIYTAPPKAEEDTEQDTEETAQQDVESP